MKPEDINSQDENPREPQPNKACLAIYDITGIQEFIFSSTKAKENIGASIYVQKIFETGLVQCIKDKVDEGTFSDDWKENSEIQFDNALHTLKAEILYIGGGNAMILFDKKDTAIEITKELSKKILEDTQGTLGIAVAYLDTDLSDFQKDKAKIFRELSKNKARPSLSVPMRGIAITRVCADGLPSSGKTDASYSFISDAAHRKLEQEKQFFFSLLPENCSREFPSEFDELGRVEGESHIAVVHIDGNSMGRFIDNTLKNKQDYTEAVKTIRDISINIDSIYKEVFKDMVSYCNNAITEDNAIGKIALKKDTLPIRPLILNGDDVTFVCDGRIGIQLAVFFLQALSQKKLKDHLLSACAGIAIVKSHFPFYRAYELAESLCSSAKRKAKFFDQEEPGCWFDYHLVYAGFQTDLDAMRNSQYNVPGMKPASRDVENTFPQYNLLLRPFYVTGRKEKSDPMYQWEQMSNLFIEMQKIPRSRLKKFRNSFINSKQEVELREIENTSRGYDLPDYEFRGGVEKTNRENLFREHQTPYFEPLELLDYYTPELESTAQEET